MDEAEYFRAKARQCRRLAKAITDRLAVEQLEGLAAEFEAQAAAADARLRAGRAPGHDDPPEER